MPCVSPRQMYFNSAISDSAKLLKPVLVFAFAIAAALSGLTQITQHRSHPVDIYAGFAIGAFIAAYLVSRARLEPPTRPRVDVFEAVASSAGFSRRGQLPVLRRPSGRALSAEPGGPFASADRARARVGLRQGARLGLREQRRDSRRPGAPGALGRHGGARGKPGEGRRGR